jgi:hypothetical protein
MVGTTLIEIREHIEALASADGEYYLICGRTGDRPVPAAGKRFEGRATAQSAARATEQFRAALRRYDPRLPYHDVIVCQDTGPLASNGQLTNRARDGDEWTLSKPVLNTADRNQDHQDLVEFCHRVAAAVFETLSDAGYDAVETAVMDAYFELAEAVTDQDHLCVCLLESMSTELDTRLSPVEQADVLARASTRVTLPDSTKNPITATFSLLQERGLLKDYTHSPLSGDLDGGTRSTEVTMAGYALSPQHDRLPVLPIVLDLYRRQPGWPLSTLRVTENGDKWTITIVLTKGTEPTGLASAPIYSKV